MQRWTRIEREDDVFFSLSIFNFSWMALCGEMWKPIKLIRRVNCTMYSSLRRKHRRWQHSSRKGHFIVVSKWKPSNNFITHTHANASERTAHTPPFSQAYVVWSASRTHTHTHCRLCSSMFIVARRERKGASVVIWKSFSVRREWEDITKLATIAEKSLYPSLAHQPKRKWL